MSYINQIVNVDSYYFLNCLGKLKSFPRQIEFNNTQYTFSDGLQYRVQKDNKDIRIFEMTDGSTTYRLRREDDQWLLVGTR